MTLILFLVLGSFGLYVMSPEQRARILQTVLAQVRRGIQIARTRYPDWDAFRDALRERERWALVTPALAALNVIVFVMLLRGAGPLDDPDTLVAWGASVGPRTTNGEWWRLATAMFVHAGLFQLLINVAALVQIGLVLERIVGRLAFAGAYLVAGLFASLVSVSVYPVDVSAGASGAIYGLYGMWIATVGWAVAEVIIRHRAAKRAAEGGEVQVEESIEPRPEPIAIPLLSSAKSLAPILGLFFLFNVANGSLGIRAEFLGFIVGIVCGLAVTKGALAQTPEPRRVGIAMGVVTAFAVIFAVPLRGISNVKPEIGRVLALEDQTTRGYQAAADQIKTGRVSADALAMLIDRTIVPEFQAADARLKALHKVPEEQQALVADAEEYVRLRTQSWRLRAEGLRKSLVRTSRKNETDFAADTTFRLQAEAQHRNSVLTFGNAEGTERASLEALQKIKLPDPK